MTNPEAPSGLGDRGRRLWRDSLSQGALTPAQLVILEEACRIADRLDLLDSIIRVAAVGVNDEEQSPADFQRWLAESRQQSATLRSLLGEIGAKSAASKTTAPSPAVKGAAGVSDLSARIAARRKKSSG